MHLLVHNILFGNNNVINITGIVKLVLGKITNKMYLLFKKAEGRT